MNAQLTVGSLFSGIGGFDLGLERAGMRTIWQSEVDPYCQRILSKHWPDTQRIPDVHDINVTTVPRVDVICGGFPCPVVSQAARGRNTAVSMWPQYARVLCDLQPRYVIVENVEGLLSQGRQFGRILGDLAEAGFDACWRVLRASDFGAPHHRARVWLVGYPHQDSQPGFSLDDETPGMPQLCDYVREWPNPPEGLGMADGLPDRLDRLHTLGNALVPRIAEWIGARIIAYEEGCMTRRMLKTGSLNAATYNQINYRSLLLWTSLTHS